MHKRMGGILALVKIREIDPKARVLMLTASGDKTKVLEALKLGALDYIVKPFDPTRLIEGVEKALPS